MPRGWKPADDLAQLLWRQILRGPRPPAVSWPSAQDKAKGKGTGGRLNVSREVGEQRNRRWQGRVPRQEKTSERRSPDDVAADHQSQIDKLERAIEVLGEDNVEAAGLVASLKKLRTKSVAPVGERLDACQQFVERERKRFAAAEEAVMKALQTKSRLECELEEGLSRLKCLREEAAAQTAMDQSAPVSTEEVSSAVPVSAPSMAEFREMVSNLEREISVASGDVKAASSREPPPCISHLQCQLWSTTASRSWSTSANFDFGQFQLRPIRLRPILFGLFDHPKFENEKKKKQKRTEKKPNGRDSQYSPCLCECVAGRRPATHSHKHGLCPLFGFQQAFMWSIAGRRPAMLHMKVC